MSWPSSASWRVQMLQNHPDEDFSETLFSDGYNSVQFYCSVFSWMKISSCYMFYWWRKLLAQVYVCDCCWISPFFLLWSFCQLFQVLLVFTTIVETQWSTVSSIYCKDMPPNVYRPHSVTITEFGAVGDGVTLNTKAFQNAIFYLNSFADKGGAQLFVPAGRWLTGSFNLISHLTLSLDKDAVIIGSPVRWFAKIICTPTYSLDLMFVTLYAWTRQTYVAESHLHIMFIILNTKKATLLKSFKTFCFFLRWIPTLFLIISVVMPWMHRAGFIWLASYRSSSILWSR